MANGKNWFGLEAMNARFGSTPAERLRNRSVLDPVTGCLLWQGSKNQTGHGRMYVDGRLESAHRVAWVLAKGPVPKGKIICHHCDTPACVNVDHLYAGTHQDNSDDITHRGRRNSRAGDLNPNRRLSSDAAAQIRRDARSGPVLAKIHNVNRSTINRIKRGAGWSAALLLCLAVVYAPPDAQAQVRVIDGDTVALNGATYRLFGIDAPELKQECDGWIAGQYAAAVLRGLVDKRVVVCIPRTTDRYGRTVAICLADGVDVGAEMVRRGMAWAFVKYSRSYVDLETAAKAEELGIHAHRCKAAWEWRQEKRN